MAKLPERSITDETILNLALSRGIVSRLVEPESDSNLDKTSTKEVIEICNKIIARIRSSTK